MATYTDNYQLTLPTYAEVADIATINNNMTKIDEIMHDSQISIATAYDASTTSENPYNTGDIVMYEKIAYKCKYDGVYGTWDASKWEQTTLADNLGGDASEISYDNITSGMTATNVQDAIDELEGNIEDVSDGLDDAVESLAPAFDPTETYNEGDIVSKDNKLYQCNTDNTTGDWDSTKWDEYVVSEHMGEGGSTVTITPETIAEPKQKIADFEIDGASGSLYAPIVEIEGHASGAIASFPDGANNKPLKSLKVAINPVQASGTPTPENPLPISGWTGANIYQRGKNLFEGHINNRTIGETGNLASSTSYVVLIARVKKGCNYIYSADATPTTISAMSYFSEYPSDSEEAIGNTRYTNVAQPFTAVYDGYVVIRASKSGWTGGTKYQLEVGNIATSYEEFSAPTVYPITWSEAGTVYFANYNINGVLTNEAYVIDFTNVNTFGATEFGTTALGVPYLDVYYINDKRGINNGKALSNCYDYISTSLQGQSGKFKEYSSSVTIYNSNFTSREQALASLASDGVQIIYELASPQTYQLTPTQITSLLGNNNLWSDTGDITECVYQRDLNLVINQFDARITALEQALSGTRSLSLSKSAVKEEETKEEPKEEEKEEEETKEEER